MGSLYRIEVDTHARITKHVAERGMNDKAYERIALVMVAVAALAYTVNLILAVPGLRTEGAAAWVQAVGSIAAIIGAVWISQDQHRKEIEREGRQAQERVRELQVMLLSIMEDAVRLIEDLPLEPRHSSEIDDYLRFRSSRAQFENVERILTEVPLFETGDPRIPSIVVNVIDSLDRVKRLHEYASSLSVEQRVQRWEQIAGTAVGERDAVRIPVDMMASILNLPRLKKAKDQLE